MKEILPDGIFLKCMWKSSDCDLVLALNERELERSGNLCPSGVQADAHYLACLRRDQRERVREIIR